MHHRVTRTAALAAAVLALPWSHAVAQAIRTQRVQFARGANSATVTGALKGDETIDYLVSLRAGQPLNVSMATRTTSLAFNIMEPGEQQVAIYNGSVNGLQYEGTTARDGDYRIRVYLVRASARRGSAASFRLEVIAGAAAATPAAAAKPAAAALRFNATGKIPCATAAGQPMGQCDFGVKRTGPGDATVVITHPGGRTRTILFRAGRAADYQRAAGERTPLTATREADLHVVRIGTERYEIPDAVITGG